MNKLLIAAALAISAGPALAGGNAAPLDHGHAAYRQVVLQGTPIAPENPLSRARVGDTRILGSYAHYLVYLGVSRNDAIVQAQRAGERAEQADPARAVENPQFSSHERYQRSVLGRSDGEILRERQASSRRLAKAGAGGN